MVMIVLKTEIVDRIKSEPLLFGGVANALGIAPSTLTRLLLDNHAKLTQASVLKFIREYLKIKKDSDLLEEMQDA